MNPVDFSDPMLRAAARRFRGDDRVELVRHDLSEPLSALGRFDAVVSSMAIHHLEHDRKRSLYAEVFDLLQPGGVFANFEHVASPTARLHVAFFAAIDEPLEHEDPSDRLLDVETQLTWLRAAAFDDVDCSGSGWRWPCSWASSRASTDSSSSNPSVVCRNGSNHITTRNRTEEVERRDSNPPEPRRARTAA